MKAQGMKVIFAGTPEFACTALERLLAAGFEVPLVLTQPDRPAGRGMKMQASPVKQCAQQRGITVLQPRSLRLDGDSKYPEDAASAKAALEASGADVWVVAAYGLLLPRWSLEMPRLGCLNIHASLLPRWRGAAPIHRAIEAGDTHTGISIMQMDEGLDTGAVCLEQSLAIDPKDTTASLHDKLATLGGELIVQALMQAKNEGFLKGTPQPSQGVSYAHKIEKYEAWIDWRLPAAQLERRLRAFTPFPGAATQYGAETVKVWQAEALEDFPEAESTHPEHPPHPPYLPGQVLAADAQKGLVVACGNGALRLMQLQRPGGKRLTAAEFLRGFPLEIGTVMHGA